MNSIVNISKKLQKKFQKLKDIIKKYKSAIIAFSGGVDSTFLAYVANEILGKDNVLLVTAKSETYPDSEFKSAKKLAKKFNFNWIYIKTDELNIKNFKKNPVNRCYYCKSELFTKLKSIAKEKGYESVFDGSNYDDLKDYRPGMKALSELGIISPLKEAKLKKEEIRTLSRCLNLPTWNKPAFACLASRFPYYQNITIENIKKIDIIENFLRKKFKVNQIRARFHNEILRIEVEKSDFEKIIKNSEKIVKRLKKFGFKFITLDLEGYRTGSMNLF